MDMALSRPQKSPDYMTDAELEGEAACFKSLIAKSEADASGRHSGFDYFDMIIRFHEEQLGKIEAEIARRKPSS